MLEAQVQQQHVTKMKTIGIFLFTGNMISFINTYFLVYDSTHFKSYEKNFSQALNNL